MRSFNMIIGESDPQAWEFGQRVIAEAGAIGNSITSASTDSNEGGTADHLQQALSQDLEVGNMAFMGFPAIYGSVDTVASKIDEIAAETGVDGMLFSWAGFVPGIRDFGQRVMPKLRCLKG